MAAASSRSEGLSVAAASEVFVSGAEPEPPRSFEVKARGADGTSFSSSSQRCNCCPYGYHIDLDFLHFLDSLYNAENLKTLKRFKRGTNSLLSPVPSDCSDVFSPNHECARETENMVLIADDDGVSPREIIDEIDTSLCRTSTTSPTRLVCHVRRKQTATLDLDRHSASSDSAESSLRMNALDGSAAESSVSGKTSDGGRSVSRMEVKLSSLPLESSTNLSASGTNISVEGIFDAESGRVSPNFLQAIREQLAVSIRRMKELEEQVKVIPILQSRISMLKEENSLLMLTADRTFRDVAVGDFSVIDDVYSSENVIPLSPTGANGHKTIKTSELSSLSVDTRNSVEDLNSLSLTSNQSKTILSFSSNFKTADACVNTDDASEPGKEFRSVGILSKATTSDSCVGTSVEFVDCGTGDDIVANNDENSYLLTKQSQMMTIISSSTVSESKSNERLSYMKHEIGDVAVNASDTFSGSLNFNKSEICTSGTDLERFRSVATRCEDWDLVKRNDGSEEREVQQTVDLPNDQRLTNEKSTQTDDFLIVEYASEILKLGTCNQSPDNQNDNQANVQSAEVSKKRITFGKVTFYEAEPPNNEVFIINGNDTLTEQRDESMSSEDLPASSHSQTQGVKGRLGSSGQGPVECVVIEQVLESARCGESVIIYDSDLSSATSSDSEDSSALSVLEVNPCGASIPKAVKSVDEYFDEGIAVEEKDDEKNFVIGEKIDSLTDPARQEETGVDVLSSKNIQSLDPEKLTETTEISEHSENTQTSFTSDENSVQRETVSEYLASSSSNGEIYKETVGKVNAFSEEVVDHGKITDADFLNAEDLSKSVFPAADHLEMILFLKKHPRMTVDLLIHSPESSISSVAESEMESRNQPSDIVTYNTVSECEVLNSSDNSQSSATKKKIIITETRIERRRIDRSNAEEKIVRSVDSQSSDDRSSASDVGSEVLTESEKNAEYIDKDLEKIGVASGPGLTEHSSEDISSRCQDKNPDVETSTEKDEITEAFRQSVKSNEQEDEIPKDDLPKTNIHYEGNEDEGESHNEAYHDSEKQFNGNICDALTISNQWLLSPEGTDLEKISALDFVRKQWFAVCGRKTSSPMEVKTFLSLASSYSDSLLQTVVNMADADGNTALHYAVSYSNTDVIKHLLDTGLCDVSHQNKAGYTAIMLAALLLVDLDRHRAIIQNLFESGNVNVPSALSGQTALMLAASHGRNDTVQLLMTCGANVNAQDEDGSTALMCASEHGHIDIIKTLLSHADCDSTLSDIDGSTALSIAMEEGYQDIGVLLYAHMKALQGSSPPSNGRCEKDDREPESSSAKR